MKCLVLLLLCLVLYCCTSKNNNIDCSSADIEKVDTCLLGETMQTAIEKLQVDSNNIVPIVTSARNIKGIYLRSAGACYIELLSEKEYIMTDAELDENPKQYYKKVLNFPVESICWQKPKEAKAKHIGKMTYLGCGRYFGF